MNLNNINSGNIFENNNNLNKFQSYNNYNTGGNINYINNNQNNRNKVQNIAHQTYDQGQNLQILKTNNNYNYEINNKINSNMNNDQIYQNRILNNNVISYSPLSNNQNAVPLNSKIPNLNYIGPKLIKNNITNNNNMSLSSQSAKNIIPNNNINIKENVDLSAIYMQNTENKHNNQGFPILVNNNMMTDVLNAPRLIIPNNSRNSYIMKNNQINNFHNEINSHNNKFYKYGGKKKEYNPEFNENNKKSNSNNKINPNNKNFNKIKKINDVENAHDKNINEKNKNKPIIKINLKCGNKIINMDLYSNLWMEAAKTMAAQFKLNENYLKLIFRKINEAVMISKNIFDSSIDFYTYKQMIDIMELNEIRNNTNYLTNKRKSKSVNGKNLINRYKDNDIMIYLCDIKKTANLNNSF